MLHTKTVEKKTFELLKQLMTEPSLSQTRLVGGTALALQIGHRKSTDLDLFSTEALDIQDIAAFLRQQYGYIPQYINGKSTIGFIDGIKIDVIYHPYKWIEDPIVVDNIRLASTADVAAMKIHAITNSGTRPKDFVDIAFLSKAYSYDTLKALALEKYPHYDEIMFDRAILYFNDVTIQKIKEIKMVNFKMDWNAIQQRIVSMTDKPEKTFNTPPLKKQIKSKLTL